MWLSGHTFCAIDPSAAPKNSGNAPRRPAVPSVFGNVERVFHHFDDCDTAELVALCMSQHFRRPRIICIPVVLIFPCLISRKIPPRLVRSVRKERLGKQLLSV